MYCTGFELFIPLVVFSAGLATVEGKSLSDADDSETQGSQEVWLPPGVSRDDWFRCHGLPCDEWERIKEKLKKLSDDDGVDEECMLFSEEQVDILLKEKEESKQNKREESGTLPKSRKKRSLTIELNKWSNPLLYKFDGSHYKNQRETIRKAFQEWEQKTCVRFFEVNWGAPLSIPHLVLTKNADRKKCQSFVGRLPGRRSQVLNLGEECMEPLGKPMHEIGHSLGLWHTQQRDDRDDHVIIHWDKIDYYRSMFARQKTDNRLPYDYGSVMHYPWNAGSYAREQTIEPRRKSDKGYKMSMGQRVEISFYDAKMVNMEYCANSCRKRPMLRRPCLHGGYQDPTDCTRCRCPDGFGGYFCDEVAPSVNAKCGGERYLEPGVSELIQSPGYDSPRYYQDDVMCAWHVKAPKGFNISLHFEGEFGLYCYERETCYHWVEVKFGHDLAYPGVRYCCYRTPSEVINSTSNEMVIIFKSTYYTRWETSKRGFRARVYTNPPGLVTPQSAPAPAQDMDDVTTDSGERWTPWGPCTGHACPCGGCSYRTKYRLCNGEICSDNLPGDVQIELCDNICTERDKLEKFAGTYYYLPCPVCCPNYSPTGAGRCVRDTW